MLYFAQDHTPSAIFLVMHERERYFNRFLVAAFLASAALNDSKWALQSKLPPMVLARSHGKTGEPLRPLTLENKALYGKYSTLRRFDVRWLHTKYI